MAKLAMDDRFFFAKALKWYKRPDVQEAILADCERREVSPRFGEGFGKRPDALFYPADVMSFAAKKMTSLHCSEERWRDPLNLQTGSSRKELDDLRVGWDLVLDIDCPYWYFSKLTAALFVTALRDHGVKSIGAKFSGNKGFHIGVPFEAFPAEVDGRPMSALFPDAPRAIAGYLLDYISTRLITVRENTIVFDRKYKISFEKLQEVTRKGAKEFIHEVCRRCRAPKADASAPSRHLFLCTGCGHTRRTDEYHDFLACERCNGVMEAQRSPEGSERCRACGHDEFEPRFNVLALIEVDTILLASRHLFRTPYSLHEKSGLVSVVFPAKELMAFEKERAKPENVVRFPRFLDGSRASPAEGAMLLQQAFELVGEREKGGERKEFAIPEEAIPEELFPPCMRNILAGLVDGKKRAMFALTNFLRACGWGQEQIAARLEEWNRRNPEPLREVIVKGHVRYLKQKREVFPPPNCRSFYQDIRVCQPDQLCGKIKNPAQYAKRKAELATQGAPGAAVARTRLTEEQKEMRRAYRARKKEGAAQEES